MALAGGTDGQIQLVSGSAASGKDHITYNSDNNNIFSQKPFALKNRFLTTAAAVIPDGTAVVEISSSLTSQNWTLPLAANNPGAMIFVKDIAANSGGKNHRIQRQGSDTIDNGTALYTIPGNSGILALYSDGIDGWWIINFNSGT